MNREYQLIYRLRENGTSYGPLQKLCLVAESEQDVRDAVGSSDLLALDVTEIRPVVDWEKPVWDLEEFAAAMSIKGGTLSKNKGDGLIPWSSVVNGCPRRVALKWIESTLNEAGKSIVRKLEMAA